MDFPAVTICNLNMMKASLLRDNPRYRNISAIDKRRKKEIEVIGDIGAHVNSGSKVRKVEHRTEVPRTVHGLEEYLLSTVRKISRHARFVAGNISDELSLAASFNRTDAGRFNDSNSTGSTGTKPYSSSVRRVDAAELLVAPRWTDANTSVPRKPMDTSREGSNDVGKITFSLPSGNESDSGSTDFLLRDKKHVKSKDMTATSSAADFEYHESGFSSVSNDYEFDELMSQSTSSDYSDIFQLLKPTSEDLLKYGHQPEDFIVQCSFDTKNCSYR